MNANSANWLKRGMDAKGLTTSQLSRILRNEYGVNISRQVLDNWIRMEDERIPVHIGNLSLVCALAQTLGYHDMQLFLSELGYFGENEEEVPREISNLQARLGNYTGQEAEAIALLITQILDRWTDVEQLMSARN